MDKTIDESFALISQRFKSFHTGGLFHVYQFDIYGWGKRFLFIKDGNIQLCEGEHYRPDVVIRAKEEDYLDIINGRVSLPTAFITGAISVTGSLNEAEFLAEFFPNKEGNNANILTNL